MDPARARGGDALGVGMSEKDTNDSGEIHPGPRARPSLDGVVLVSVGRARDDAPLKGIRRAHVARIHDLPSLIHALTPEAS
jgi:hypothetical protein